MNNMNKNLINNSKMAEYFLIFNIYFDIRLEVEYFDLYHQFFASPTLPLRLQRFVIRLDDESQSETPLRRNFLNDDFSWL